MLPNDREKLRQQHYAIVGLFVACLIFSPLAILLMVLLEISPQTRNSLVGTIFGGVIVLVLLQFSKRCPGCGANLGIQLRLGIPKHCRRCGARLR